MKVVSGLIHNSSSNIPIPLSNRERIYPMADDRRDLHRFRQLQEILLSLRREFLTLSFMHDSLKWERVESGKVERWKDGKVEYIPEQLSEISSGKTLYPSILEAWNLSVSSRDNSTDEDNSSEILSAHQRFRYSSSCHHNPPQGEPVVSWNPALSDGISHDNPLLRILPQVHSMYQWGEEVSMINEQIIMNSGQWKMNMSSKNS